MEEFNNGQNTGNVAQCYRQPGWEGSLGRMETRICMADSLCCPPETITTLLISYAQIYNRKLKNMVYIYV